MKNLSKNQIIELSKTELTQNQINSFKFGNTPNQETKIHSAIIHALEISEIYNHQEGKKVVQEKMIERVLGFNSINELEKSNELLLTGINA